MPNELPARIAQLTDYEASDACLALTTLLETVLPVAVDTSDLETLVDASDSRVASLYTDLRRTADEDAVQGARSLLLLTADLGFEAQVEAAIGVAGEHSRDGGVLSVPLLIAGLAAVIAAIPKEQRNTSVTVRRVNPDGSVVETARTESETIRVGAEAVEKLASWWRALLRE